MKKYIEPITAIENAFTADLFMTTATNGSGEPIGDGPIGPGSGDGDIKERDEFDAFMEYVENEEDVTKKSLW